MMVNGYGESHLMLVRQVDHSQATGSLAAHWGNDDFAKPTPHTSMALAAQEHDSGWWEEEMKPTLNSDGRPLDYIGSIGKLDQFWFDFITRGIDAVINRDPYAGLFVIWHQVGLCTQGSIPGFEGSLLKRMPDLRNQPHPQAFIDDRLAVGKRLLEELRESDKYRDVSTDEHLWRNYKFLEVVEQMGQFVANKHPFNSNARRNGPPTVLENVPVAPNKPDTTLTFDVIDESRAIVRPYPFDIDPLPFTFVGRVVEDRRYRDEDDFQDAFLSAERVTVTHTLHGA